MAIYNSHLVNRLGKNNYLKKIKSPDNKQTHKE